MSRIPFKTTTILKLGQIIVSGMQCLKLRGQGIGDQRRAHRICLKDIKSRRILTKIVLIGKIVDFGLLIKCSIPYIYLCLFKLF
jgi:hypothetical protein